ncbi:MAG: D-alanyl-D-alanine carboxypeptidase family protein [Eubacteriales bacterium]|nr:D-alanyl-D-alanine carboxypeptidase family protein [Eubacteriales bacterium]
MVYGAEEELMESPHGVLMEAATGEIIYEKEKDVRISPASITKIMTLLLIFEELDQGNLSLEEEVTTSAYAKSMGGSQVFLEEGEKQTVETMIKCIVIASGNDASVAMAEHVAGSESEFVKRMNARAQTLHMENTHFEDCCGLTDSSNHYTTAEDVAIMSRELIVKHPQVLDYSSIWMEDITHVTRQGSKQFTLTNTNKLIRSYEGCVGLKTGSTSLAKYCVSTVAKRGEITLIAVVMTAPDYKVRFKDAAALLNYGFGRCSLYVDENTEKLRLVSVKGGVEDQVACEFEHAFRYLDTTGKTVEGVEKKIVLPKEAKAPIKKGDKAGEAVYYLNGEEIGRVDILYKADVEKASFVDYLKKAGKRFLNG